MTEELYSWAESTVADEFGVQLGKRLDAAVNRGDLRPCINNRAVRWGHVLVSESILAPLTKADIRDLRLVTGDVLVCEGGEIGRASVWNDELPEAYFLNTLHRLRSKGRYEPRLLVAFLERWATAGDLSAIVGKSSIAHLTKENLLRVRIPLPAPAEQKRMVEALLAIDQLVTGLERLIIKKQAIKQGMMQRLLTGRTRLPGFTNDWEIEPIRYDISLISGQHVLARYCNTDGRGVPYLTGPADFPDGRIRQTKFTDRPTSICQADDILVTVKGSGAGALVLSDSSYCISRQLMAIRTNAWDSRFLFYSLLENASNIKEAATGLIPGLSRSDILDLEIPVPSVVEQHAIANVLSDADKNLNFLEARLAKVRDIKAGMTQQLLTGRTRLPVPEAAL